MAEYKDLTAQLRLFETVCRHSEKPDIADLVRCAWQAIEKLQTPKWIPVTERLPTPTFAREWYLVALESGCVQTLAFEKGGYSFEFEKDGFSDNLFQPGWHETASPVTHWMPLPEPPKEET